MKRGLDRALARQVAQQLTERDVVGAHLRDELGIHPEDLARPFQAAWTSAFSFAVFAAVPILFLLIAPEESRIPIIVTASLLCLGALGALGAKLGGAPIGRATFRVLAGGVLAMGLTAGIGRLFGVATL